MTIKEGTQLGPYRVEAMIGEGGMGMVYRALDNKLNRPVAIKFSGLSCRQQVRCRRLRSP
jgi:hypothetical protein